MSGKEEGVGYEHYGDLEMQDIPVGREVRNFVENPLNTAETGRAQTEDEQIRDSSVTVHHVIRNPSKSSNNSSFLGPSVTDILGEGNVSYDKFLKLSKNFKKKIDDACRDWVDDDDEKSFLTSSHLILYKWHDYMSVPIRHPFANILWGARAKDNDGNYIEDDNNRFLFLFHDSHSFFIMGVAYIVIFGEISILIAIVSRLFSDNCNHGLPKGTVTLVPLILCTLYASSVAAEAFFRFTPFELTGQSMESYCAIADILLATGKATVPRHINFLKMFSADLNRIAIEQPERREQVNKILVEAALRDSSTFILSIALQFANILLLTTVAIVMGTSHDLLTLISNFISVEIVVHIHEFVPKALRLKDLSPQSFNSSYTAVSHIAFVRCRSSWRIVILYSVQNL